ncbi:hypothetical protein ACP4OV_028537 [Aristida adscensionis]
MAHVYELQEAALEKHQPDQLLSVAALAGHCPHHQGGHAAGMILMIHRICRK